jgi:thiol-disulfide isomerase/thioredoxin
MVKLETRNQKSEGDLVYSPPLPHPAFCLLHSAFYLLLSAFCLLLPAFSLLPLTATLAQAPDQQALTPTNFRAPDFPVPASPPVGSAPFGSVPSGPALPGTQTTNALPAGENLETSLWINSPTLTMGQLRGQVVLIDFWEYTCINCIRTFAQNKEWLKRYHKYGFEIIGVHDPEFDIAYRAANVRVAAERFGLPYPVFVDPGFRLWQAYHNDSWPSRFLVDSKGIVRFHRDGEGGDNAFEHAIQRFLVEAHPGLKFPADYTIPPEPGAFAPSCGIPTNEMYVGDWSGRGILANREGYHDGKTIRYELPADINDGQAAVSGPWETDKNGMIYRGKKGGDPGGPDKLLMRYHARELYAVINVSHGHPSALYIQQDGKDLSAANKGVDVKYDSQGHSYIEIREPRMYYLVQNPAFGAHSVTLTPTRPGLTVNSFTFGNDCQTKFPHL